MLLAASFLLAAWRLPLVEIPTLSYYYGYYVFREGGKAYTVPTSPEAVPRRNLIAFRRNGVYAVWDARGLTVRHGVSSRSSRLEDFPVSDRFFSHAEILANIQKIRSGDSKKGATALSGALRVGLDTYFLVRWQNRSGTPWAEALVRVPLNGKTVWPSVVGRFSGLSIAYRSVDDRLFLLENQLAIVCRRGDVWGVASFDPKTGIFDFRSLGATLLSYLSTGRRTGLFVERTSYGATVAGRVDLILGVRKVVFEGRGPARFLDTVRPFLVAASDESVSRLINAETGAELRLPRGFCLARAGDCLLTWTTRRAMIYRPERWDMVATRSERLP